MARHVILESYTFTPATKTVTVTGKNIRREQLLLITNTTTNTVIYNFSDPSQTATSYSNTVDAISNLETTTIVLMFNTTSMQATDKLAIVVEETYTEMLPAETLRDPVDKLRVSTPQSLIDTDFEYGMQPTKWETLNLVNNRPSAFYDVTAPLVITNITASSRVVTVSTTTPPALGTPIFVTGTFDGANADGWWVVETVSAGVSFTFSVTNIPSATLYDSTKSYVYAGTFFTGAAIPAATTAITVNGAIATVNTTNAHGLRIGDGIYVVGTTGATGTMNSSWVVASTPTNTSFTFSCAATGTITATLNASIYPRSLGYSVHRPFDGGVQFSNVQPYHGYQVIRQTRRQFRYQSGKGLQFSTGSILKPAITVDNMTSSGATVTVTCKYPHGLLPGAAIKVIGAVTAAGASDTYNGTGVSGGSTYVVLTASTPTTFTYAASSTPSVTPALGFPITVSPMAWYGSSNRVGMFDSQNGFYFEFDGQTIYAVKRSSTTQISGVAAVTAGSQSVVGTNTKFGQHLKPGDFIVIRGMSYLVQVITSDTQMYIYPEYRGTTSSGCTISKTINQRFPQSQWNIDRCDGTGVSLYNLDLTKMQMFYGDYTWYGAGAIRFGFKNNRGEVIYCHRIPNNNVNTEAYMRSGNLPARYETNTIPYQTFLTATLSSATGAGGTIAVADTAGWPNSGTMAITTASATSAPIEFITYSAKTATSFTIAARGQAGGSSAQTFTYSATAPIRVELYSPQCASTISHWGSSVIMDGRYDDDKSFIFNYGMTTPVTYATAGQRYPVFSVRLAPSVDNGLTGLLGARELINRMQLAPASVGVFTTTAGVRIEVWLNARVSAGTYVPVGGSSLAQYSLHVNTTTMSGGEPIFTFIAPAGGVSTQDLSKIRDIGNSILGGGNTLSAPNTPANLYPDGPDVLTIAVIPLAANASVTARLNWTEAQA